MPLLGDPLYPDGGRFNNLKDTRLKGLISHLGRQALHARVLGFIHPVSGQYLEFTSEPPADFSDMVSYLRAAVVGTASFP
jgi:23S rRNA pseudouridine1911/1915/1917 synthase